jgi:simple sugar transport system substrate-binding protein
VAIGTQHGNVTAFIAKALKDAGRKPGEITVGGIDLSPATIDALKKGYVSVTLDQQLYLQGFLPVMQCVLSKKYGLSGARDRHRRRRGHPSSIGALVPLIDKGIR